MDTYSVKIQTSIGIADLYKPIVISEQTPGGYVWLITEVKSKSIITHLEYSTVVGFTSIALLMGKQTVVQCY